MVRSLQLDQDLMFLARSLLAGVVGWIIRTIEQQVPLAGRIVTGLIGMGWSIAAVFVSSVIVQEQPVRNPIEILRQSAMTLRRTWGEGLIGYLGFSAGSMVLFLCSLLPLLLAGAVALILKSVGLIIVAGVLYVLAPITLPAERKKSRLVLAFSSPIRHLFFTLASFARGCPRPYFDLGRNACA